MLYFDCDIHEAFQCQLQAKKTLPRPDDMMVARDFMIVQVPPGGYTSHNKHPTSTFYTETSIPMIGANNYVDSSMRKETFQDASHGARTSPPHPPLTPNKLDPSRTEENRVVNTIPPRIMRPPPSTSSPTQYISKPRILRERESDEVARKIVTPLRNRDQKHQFNAANMDIWDFKHTTPGPVQRTGTGPMKFTPKEPPPSSPKWPIRPITRGIS